MLTWTWAPSRGGRSGVLPLSLVVRVGVVEGFGDVSDRGSMCRHNDVRESGSQCWYAQNPASSRATAMMTTILLDLRSATWR